MVVIDAGIFKWRNAVTLLKIRNNKELFVANKFHIRYIEAYTRIVVCGNWINYSELIEIAANDKIIEKQTINKKFGTDKEIKTQHWRNTASRK